LVADSEYTGVGESIADSRSNLPNKFDLDLPNMHLGLVTASRLLASWLSLSATACHCMPLSALYKLDCPPPRCVQNITFKDITVLPSLGGIEIKTEMGNDNNSFVRDVLYQVSSRCYK
jgi:hypothetical protein